ncbi:hypothetical protein [Taibaiella koreensis]|uniref:hypothetical protein n=1 Tax=Taibaiella koreensis TaxID=1268548 RepID=UPI000E5A0160|nr:hypothetical protein [Taibaiella koreensis]
MKITFFLILAFLLCLPGGLSRAIGNQAFYEKRLQEIIQTKDTFIAYYRDCSCCISGLEASGYFLYREGNDYYFEYYRWKEGKLISRFKTRKKSREAHTIFRYAANNYDSLSQYQGRIAFTIPVKVTVKTDSIHTESYVEPQELLHGPYGYYLIAFGDKRILTTLKGPNDIGYYFSRSVPVGTFLLILNMLYYKYSFDKFLDS